MTLSAAVITVTSGRPSLAKCIQSVANQTFPAKHYIATDAIIDFDNFINLKDTYSNNDVYFSYWPTKIGGYSLEGRRLYASLPSLINEDVIFMLNDDDWFEHNHVESLMNLISIKNLGWAYSLRKIYDSEGNFLFNDDCEALGEYSAYNTPGAGFAEHSAMAVRTEIFLKHSNCFNYRGYGVDRYFYNSLKNNEKSFEGSGIYSLCYTLGGNPMSVTKEFFEIGNQINQKLYPEGFPWAKKVLQTPGNLK